MLWLWGVNIFGFLRSRVNYAKVFDLDHNHLTHREIWKVPPRRHAETITNAIQNLGQKESLPRNTLALQICPPQKINNNTFSCLRVVVL